MPSSKLITLPQVEKTIFLMRGEKIILDTHLAKLYGVTTRVLNQAVKRNKRRFPDDFHFQLTKSEKEEVITICDDLKTLRFYRGLPYAFTEHGAIMAASILNSDRAIDVSVYVVRAFVKLRETLSAHRQIAKKLNLLENKIVNHDFQIKAIFDAIKQLMEPPQKKKSLIGFERK
ncbi:MAG: ORF6N domain-containing protein [Deltaproteobacteria bacterium]|nr:ORF6N domain-containing protein [Deltaproteobacteria bacterium]